MSGRLPDTASSQPTSDHTGQGRTSIGLMRRRAILSAVKLLSQLPLRVAHGLGALLGMVYYWLPNRERRNARINIALCLPELSDHERASLLRRSLIENAKTLLEAPGIWRGRPEHWLSLVRAERGKELLERLRSQGKGVIVAAPHLGSWEVGKVVHAWPSATTWARFTSLWTTARTSARPRSGTICGKSSYWMRRHWSPSRSTTTSGVYWTKRS